MIVSATHLRIRGIAGWFRFFTRIGSIQRQVAKADGVIFIKIRGLRTLTGWESRGAMLAFRNSGAHLDAMKSLAGIGQAKSVTWETDQPPTWADAIQRLNQVPF